MLLDQDFIALPCTNAFVEPQPFLIALSFAITEWLVHTLLGSFSKFVGNFRERLRSSER